MKSIMARSCVGPQYCGILERCSQNKPEKGRQNEVVGSYTFIRKLEVLPSVGSNKSEIFSFSWRHSANHMMWQRGVYCHHRWHRSSGIFCNGDASTTIWFWTMDQGSISITWRQGPPVLDLRNLVPFQVSMHSQGAWHCINIYWVCKRKMKHHACCF